MLLSPSAPSFSGLAARRQGWICGRATTLLPPHVRRGAPPLAKGRPAWTPQPFAPSSDHRLLLLPAAAAIRPVSGSEFVPPSALPPGVAPTQGVLYPWNRGYQIWSVATTAAAAMMGILVPLEAAIGGATGT